VERGYGAEYDVHLLKDGNLAVIHDSNLKRTTGQEGRVEDLTTEDLKNYRLEGTEETIPTFREVLDTFAGKTPMIIELKAEENAAALCEAACKAMEGYEGVWCMESFDPRCVYWLKKNRPEIPRGQLAENSFRNRDSKLPWYLKLVLSYHLENFLCKPDFVAYDYGTRKNLSNFLCRKLWKLDGVSWTLRSPADHKTAEKEGWIPIFEHYEP
jgi:glycerophosphoryl diester phosphodiesterase